MTCDKNCKTCMYAEVIPTNNVCVQPGITCNGCCSECQNRIVIEYKIKCGRSGN